MSRKMTADIKAIRAVLRAIDKEPEAFGESELRAMANYLFNKLHAVASERRVAKRKVA